MYRADSLVLGAVERAMMRASAAEGMRLRRGLASLAIVAGVAPLVGVMASCFRIVNSFPGFGSDKQTMFYFVIERL